MGFCLFAFLQETQHCHGLSESEQSPADRLLLWFRLSEHEQTLFVETR